MKIILQGGCLPTSEQELLLRAALNQNESAVSAWHEWQTQSEFDAMDWASHRLMPLVYHNLKSLGYDDALMGRMRGIHHRTWYKNNLLINELSALVWDFHSAGIRTLIMKGVPLALLYYCDLGLRPMMDFDVLVPFKQKLLALERIRARGWKEKFMAAHACGIVTPGGHEFDLHWHAFSENCEPHADDAIWADAISFQINNVETLTMNATDMLLNVCVHGLAWNTIPPLRWIADALMILRASPIDWSRLATHARRRHLALTMSVAMNYIARTFDAPIPANVLAELGAAPILRVERWDYAAKTIPPDERGLLLVSWAYLREYARTVHNENVTRQIFSLPRFLQTLWGVPHLWQLPIYAGMGALKRAGNWLRRKNKAEVNRNDRDRSIPASKG